ncbi:hypothetical protein LINPERPRIM_LOCUS6364 [Linum perenne]
MVASSHSKEESSDENEEVGNGVEAAHQEAQNRYLFTVLYLNYSH